MTARQKILVDAWEAFDEDEPDISTERLTAMVCQAHNAEPSEVYEAIAAKASSEERTK